MLYPYTDNYLDDISININDKKEFNNRFSRRLKGEKINYASMVLSKRFFSKENIKEKSKILPFTIKYIENLKSNLYNKFRNIKKSNDEIMNIMDKIVSIK